MSVDNLAALIERVRRCKADCATADAAMVRARRAHDAARAAHLEAENELTNAIRKLVDSKDTP